MPKRGVNCGMNAVIVGLLLFGTVFALFTGHGDAVLPAMIEGAQAAIDTALRLLPAYLVWMGLLNVAGKAGWIDALSKLLRPALRLLFHDAGKAENAISMNLAANMLGMGNAATPYGIEAMRLMEETNPRPGTATDSMCTLLCLNASCLELYPASLVALRQSFGSAKPYAVVLPTLLSSLAATLVAAALCLLCTRRCRSRS